jgi:thiamine-phosphate diphosphorylase
LILLLVTNSNQKTAEPQGFRRFYLLSMESVMGWPFMQADIFQTTRFYGILDTGYVNPKNWETKCRALLEGGAGIVQLRAKKESHDERRKLLERILPLFDGGNVPLVINDDLELAVAYPGIGLHVGQEDVCPRDARDYLGPGAILGLSTHSQEQAKGAIAMAGVLDYFAVGPIFPTGTKPDYEAVGLTLVRQVRAMNPPIPFFCIGGIGPSNAAEVREAGASGLVAVSCVLCTDDTVAAVRGLA